jgi:Fic family protein
MDGVMHLKKLVIDDKLLKYIAEIDEFKGSWKVLSTLAPERLNTLRRIATIESVGSSTRIEGSELSDDEVEKLLSGVKLTSFRARDQQEVTGYAGLMELVFNSWQEIDLTENHIKQLHSVLLKHSDKDQRHLGEYKKFPNHVEAYDEIGQSLGVIFNTTIPFDTPTKMKVLIAWTNKELEVDAKHHVLLVIATFIVRFLAIHPFQDGNGRLSRAITSLLLLRAGYLYVPYCSLERIIEENKDNYYLALRRAQGTLDKDESSLNHWIDFFVSCLLQQKRVLARKIEAEQAVASLSPLSEKLLQIVKDHGRVTVREGVTLTGTNRNTVKDHLFRLVDSGHIVKKGRGRGVWYEKS